MRPESYNNMAVLVMRLSSPGHIIIAQQNNLQWGGRRFGEFCGSSDASFTSSGIWA